MEKKVFGIHVHGIAVISVFKEAQLGFFKKETDGCKKTHLRWLHMQQFQEQQQHQVHHSLLLIQ